MWQLGLQSLPVTLLGFSRLKLVNLYYCSIVCPLKCQAKFVADDVIFFFRENKSTFYMNHLLGRHAHECSKLIFLEKNQNVVCLSAAIMILSIKGLYQQYSEKILHICKDDVLKFQNICFIPYKLSDLYF